MHVNSDDRQPPVRLNGSKAVLNGRSVSLWLRGSGFLASALMHKAFAVCYDKTRSPSRILRKVPEGERARYLPLTSVIHIQICDFDD